MRRTLLLLVQWCVLGSAAGCEDGTGPSPPVLEIRLLTNQVSYRAGDAITVVAQNVSMETLFGWFACPAILEGHGHSGWKKVAQLRDPDACDLVIVPIFTDSSLTDNFELPSDVPAGTYRLRLPGIRTLPEGPMPAEARITNVFEIR
jgi:hypothetical protein